MINISVTAYGKSKPTGYEPLEFPNTPAVRHPLDPPTLLSDAQRRIFDAFAALVPKADRTAFRELVMMRLGPGHPGDAAVRALCIAVSRNYVDVDVLRKHGLAPEPPPKRAKKVDDDDDAAID